MKNFLQNIINWVKKNRHDLGLLLGSLGVVGAISLKIFFGIDV